MGAPGQGLVTIRSVDEMDKTDGNTLRCRSRSWAFPFFLIFGTVIALLGAGLLVSGVVGQGAAKVIGLAAGGAFTALGLGFIGIALLTRRPLRLNETSLFIPKGFHSDEIPVGDVAGVGLVFKHTTPPARAPLTGWYLMIWTKDGTEHVTNIVWLPMTYGKTIGSTTKKSLSARNFDAVQGTDPAKLSEVPAAIAAKDIYERVLGVQGNQGPLATLAFQRHPRRNAYAVSPITAYWSPDGAFGYPPASQPSS